MDASGNINLRVTFVRFSTSIGKWCIGLNISQEIFRSDNGLWTDLWSIVSNLPLSLLEDFCVGGLSGTPSAEI